MSTPAFELVEAQALSSFRCIRRSCATFATEHPLHFHPSFELTWILRSAGTRYVGDSVARYGPGDLVLSGPNLPHCWREDPAPDGGNAPEWITVQFDPACFGPGFLDLPECTALRDLLGAAYSGLHYGADAVDEVGPLLRQLVSQQGLTRLLRLMEILERLTGKRRTPLAAAIDCRRDAAVDHALVERLDQVRRYIVDNLGGTISQADIAGRLDMGPSAFSKFFRAATGRTFMSLVKLLRINEACRLLATTNARITDIALDCGYGHASHFDSHFNELTGMSPSEYRRRLPALKPAAPDPCD